MNNIFYPCKAKARVKFLREHTLLDDLEANQAIVLNPDNWEIIEFQSPPHTCDSPEEPFYSERENFGRRLVYWKQTINDHGGGTAWKMTAAEFASGYGITFDGQMIGTSMDHRAKTDYARGKTKAAPSNVNAITSKQLDFDAALKTITYSKKNQEGLPEPDVQEWFRGHDDLGNNFIF